MNWAIRIQHIVYQGLMQESTNNEIFLNVNSDKNCLFSLDYSKTRQGLLQNAAGITKRGNGVLKNVAGITKQGKGY